MFKPILSVARPRWRRQMLKLILLSFALSNANGCTAVRLVYQSLRDGVPKNQWSYRKYEATSTTANTEKVEEPSMAANVAVEAETENDTDQIKPITINNRTKQKAGRSGIRQHHSVTRSNDPTSLADLGGFEDANSDSLTDGDHTESSMDRLNAALSDDALQAQMLPQHSLTALEARIRVDLLTSRARQMLEIGQLEQALRSAILAQELSESVQLDFSPEEDRPIDLVRRIEGQLETQQIDDQPVGDTELAEAADPKPESEPDEKRPKSAPPDTEKSRMAKIRRDLTTLFRREKKAANNETEAMARDSFPVKPPISSELVKENRQPNRVSATSPRDGIVVANRSVALGNVDSIDTAMILNPPDPVDEVSFETDSSNTPRLDGSLRIEPDQFDDHDHRDANSGNSEDSSLRPETDESVAPQPEFEPVEPAGPSREIEIRNDASPRVYYNLTDDDDRHADWSTFYIICGICSLFALICYRRGTT